MAFTLPTRAENANEEMLARALRELTAALDAGLAARPPATTGGGSSASYGPSLTVTPTASATQYVIGWSGDSVSRRIDSGTLVKVADTGSETVARPGAGQLPTVYTYVAVKNGQTISDGVAVEPIDADTVTPDLSVTPGTVTATTYAFTASATNPKAGGAAPTLTVGYVGCTGTPAAGAIANGTAVTVTRPTQGGSPASVIFAATLAGGGSERIQRSILPQPNDAPTLVVTPQTTATTVVITWSGDDVYRAINGGTYTKVADSGSETVTRPAAGQSGLIYTYRGDKNGVSVSDSVTVPSIDSDTVTPDLSVTPSNPTPTAQTFTVSASNPQAGGALPILSLVYVGCTGDVTGPAITNGTVVTVQRPVFGQGAGSVTFRATISGGGSETIQRTIAPQQRDTVPVQTHAEVVVTAGDAMAVDVVVTDPLGSGVTPTATAVASSGCTVALLSIIGPTTGSSIRFRYRITRPVAGTGTGRVVFTGSLPGAGIDTSTTDAVDVPSQDIPATLDVSVQTVSSTATVVSLVVTAVDPLGTATPTISITSADGVPGGVSAITGAGTSASPYVVPRSNTAPASVVVLATATGRGQGTASVAIPQQVQTVSLPTGAYVSAIRAAFSGGTNVQINWDLANQSIATKIIIYAISTRVASDGTSAQVASVNRTYFPVQGSIATSTNQASGTAGFGHGLIYDGTSTAQGYVEYYIDVYQPNGSVVTSASYRTAPTTVT